MNQLLELFDTVVKSTIQKIGDKMLNDEVEIDNYERPTFWLYTGVDEAFYKARIRRVLELLGDVSNMRILDIGCGDGRTTYELSRHAKSVVGIDSIERAVNFARILGGRENTQYYVMDMDDLDFFEDNSFDAITCLEVIEHIAPHKVKKFLEEVVRLLKPDGLFIVSSINGARRKKPNPHHHKEYTIQGLKEMVQPYFKVESIVGVLLSYPIKRYSELRKIVPFNLIFKWQIKKGQRLPEWSYDVVYKLVPINQQ